MKIQLSDHFTYKRLLRYTLPSIVMLVFTSLYGVADGFFVSNYAGKEQFTAVNFIMPFLMILGSCGFMFGTGGGALIAKTIGEGKIKKANQLFSLIIYTSAICGIVLAVFGILFIRPLASALGADGLLLENSIVYGRIILMALPSYILQFEFQCLFSTAEKPTLGLYITIAAGLTNIILDALFVAVLNRGIVGAALATSISQCIGGIIPIIYFALPNNSTFQLGKTHFDGKALAKTCVNGSSELMSNISMSIVSMLYNKQLLKYAGEDGIAAYGVLMYVSLVFQAIFIGYSVGTAPIISYNYGASKHKELKGCLKKSLILISIFAVLMFCSSYALSMPLSHIFVGYDKKLLNLTLHAFSIFSFSFLFAGYTVFGSSFFTALNNGIISSAISFLRTLVFQIAAVLILPIFWEVDGIWFSIVLAEAMAMALTSLFLKAKKKVYNY